MDTFSNCLIYILHYYFTKRLNKSFDKLFCTIYFLALITEVTNYNIIDNHIIVFYPISFAVCRLCFLFLEITLN